MSGYDDENTAETICLFGGSFDPIHLGHTHIASQAVKQVNIDKLIFLPCKQSPHKEKMCGASAEARVEMCRLALADYPWAQVDDFEIKSPETPSYSWRTAEEMKVRFPRARLLWLMGVDQWEALLGWVRSEYLASMVDFLVFTRNAKKPQEREGFKMHALEGTEHPASATQIRDSVRGSMMRSWLAPKVADYICKHNLYWAESP